MPQIFINVNGTDRRCLIAEESDSLRRVCRYIHNQIDLEDCYIIHQGKLVDLNTAVQNDHTYHFIPRIRGGKGGFGSMLRALGAQIEKTTNREACRDLSGRRMRDVNNEQSLRDWVAKAADREREKEQRRRDRLERRKAEPHHQFSDQTYDRQKAQVTDNLDDAIQQGLQRATASCSTATATVTSGSRKRKSDEPGPSSSSSKRRFDWMGDIDVSDLDSDSDTDESKESQSSSVDHVENPPVDKEEPDHSPVEDSESLHYRDTHSDSGVESVVEVKTKGSPMEIDSYGSEKDSAVNSDGDAADMLSINQSPDMQTDHSAESDKDLSGAAQHGLLAALAEKPPKQPEPIDPATVDLMTFESMEDIEALGLEVLKAVLMARGLKCGGTLQQRAQRLWAVRGLAPDQIDSSLLAKPAKGKGKGKKK